MCRSLVRIREREWRENVDENHMCLGVEAQCSRLVEMMTGFVCAYIIQYTCRTSRTQPTDGETILHEGCFTYDPSMNTRGLRWSLFVSASLSRHGIILFFSSLRRCLPGRCVPIIHESGRIIDSARKLPHASTFQGWEPEIPFAMVCYPLQLILT